MRTSEAVTGAQGIPIGYATLVIVYACLAAAVVWLLRRFSRVPLESSEFESEQRPIRPEADHAG